MTSGSPWPRRLVVLLLLVDAAVVLFGTLMAWIFIGISEFDSPRDAPGWLPPAVITLGMATAGLSLLIARHQFRPSANAARTRAVSVALHLGLAASTLVAFDSIFGAAVLVTGAIIVALTASVTHVSRAVA